MMKKDGQFLCNLLDSLHDSFVFVDTDHIIRYMNRTAIEKNKGGDALIGSSIFDCHNDKSNATIAQVFAEMGEGLEERMITDNAKCRIYMRAVRDKTGKLMGYYERYEPPVLTSVGPSDSSQ